MLKSVRIALIFFILLLFLYFQPWKVFTNGGTIYVLLCEQQYEPESVWDYHKKNTISDYEKKCKTSQLSVIKLNYKVFLEKQKVVFSGREIGVVSYNCDIYDRNNFTCPEQDLSVESGRAQLSFNTHETTVPKWRYWLIRYGLFLDRKLGRDSIYTLI